DTRAASRALLDERALPEQLVRGSDSAPRHPELGGEKSLCRQSRPGEEIPPLDRGAQLVGEPFIRGPRWNAVLERPLEGVQLLGHHGAGCVDGSRCCASPVAICRDGSLSQSLHEPTYNAASTPIASSARMVCAATTPAPQYAATSRSSLTPRLAKCARSSSQGRSSPFGFTRSAEGPLTAPGTCPATEKYGSSSPRKRSGARASISVPASAIAAASSALTTSCPPGRATKSPGDAGVSA